MINIVNMNVSTKDINSLLNKLKTFSSDWKKLPNDIANEVAIGGKKYLDELYGESKTDQTIDIGSISTEIRPDSTGYSLIASGKDVLYAEFGTGENGADNPHPRKGEFGLNPYNSGPTIKINSHTGRHFWWYQGYSEGNASGKQMYLTSDYIRKNLIKQISDKKVGEVVSKV